MYKFKHFLIVLGGMLIWTQNTLATTIVGSAYDQVDAVCDGKEVSLNKESLIGLQINSNINSQGDIKVLIGKKSCWIPIEDIDTEKDRTVAISNPVKRSKTAQTSGVME